MVVDLMLTTGVTLHPPIRKNMDKEKSNEIFDDEKMIIPIKLKPK